MPISTYSGFAEGVVVRGVPILNTYPGKVFWVSNRSGDGGSNGNDGTWQRPWATVAYAVGSGSVVAGRGDIILVKAGHAETVASAAAISMAKAGVAVVGLGTGASRPTFTFSATASTWAISAANCAVINVIGTPSIDSVVKAWHVTASGVTLDVEWFDASSTVEAVTAILGDASADNIWIKLRYRGDTGGNAVVAPIQLVGTNDGIIDVSFYGVASTAVVDFLTTACTNIKITGWVYNSGTTDGSKNVTDTATSSTWYADLVDAAAGSRFTGGSGQALASSDVADVTNALYGTTGIASFPAAAAAANNVSMAEVLRYISEQQVPRIATKSFAATGTSLTTGLSPVSAFTVTGHVMLRIFGVTGATPLASTSNNGTLAVGIAGSTTLYLGTTTMDGTNFTAGAVWIDTSAVALSEAFVAANLVWHLASSTTVIVTVATNSSTSGVLTLYCEWKPISSGATVVAA